MLGNSPSIEISQTSEYAKERMKHESEPGRYGQKPGNPYHFREYPKRMDRATRGEKGPQFEGVTAQNESEEAQFKSLGFHFGREKALTALTRDEQEHATLAAERNFEIHHGKISDGAAREVRAAEAEHGARHLPAVPVAPLKKRTRGPNKPKVMA